LTACATAVVTEPAEAEPTGVPEGPTGEVEEPGGEEPDACGCADEPKRLTAAHTVLSAAVSWPSEEEVSLDVEPAAREEGSTAEEEWPGVGTRLLGDGTALDAWSVAFNCRATWD
jgi:hypothetical protein